MVIYILKDLVYKRRKLNFHNSDFILCLKIKECENYFEISKGHEKDFVISKEHENNFQISNSHEKYFEISKGHGMDFEISKGHENVFEISNEHEDFETSKMCKLRKMSKSTGLARYDSRLIFFEDSFDI